MISKFEWFDRARLGLFIHWGIYSIPALDEWHMYRDKVPKDIYNRYAEQFCPPPEFSPEEWGKLAVRMGAKYAVLTTRHHDGFALWDSRCNPFNSVKTAAKRDFVREFADACRKHGIRVGFYYSIMNWQFYDVFLNDSQASVDARNRVVDGMHEQLHELLTGYGKVDLLWYDGCGCPGAGDNAGKLWRTEELNAMARRYQPDIIINDRSHLPEDFATPEQCVTPPRNGRRWEACMTLNQSWGYTKNDSDYKTPEILCRALLHCSRNGGNLLLNIGPRPDGSVPQESRELLESIGDFINTCPQAIYGSERTPYTEAVHAAGPVTKADGKYYLHVFHRNGAPVKIDSATLLRKIGETSLIETFELNVTDCDSPAEMLGGRHDMEVKPGEAPVLGDNTAHLQPPQGNCLIEHDLERLLRNPSSGKKKCFGLYCKSFICKELNIPLPASGIYDLELGIIVEKERNLFRIQNADMIFQTPAPGVPDTFRIQKFVSDSDSISVILPENTEIYAIRINPVWSPESSMSWQVAGFYPGNFLFSRCSEDVKIVMLQNIPELARTADWHSVCDHNLDADFGQIRVYFPYCAPRPGHGFGLARKMISSESECTVLACLGCDWWSNVYVNGEKILTGRPDSCLDGSEFMGHKPIAFPLHLRAGENEILVCNHGGTADNWFVFYTNTPCEEERKL